jgi:hypothetical protein
MSSVRAAKFAALTLCTPDMTSGLGVQVARGG